MMNEQWIVVHREAPPKPPWGQPCNGCGLCCLARPCPVGILISRRRQGACKALRWSAEHRRYWCGAITDPAAFLPPLLRPAHRIFRALARRWIAAGHGCDSTIQG
jgi:hypothetical protein